MNTLSINSPQCLAMKLFLSERNEMNINICRLLLMQNRCLHQLIVVCMLRVLHKAATYLKEEQFEGDVDEEPEKFAGTAFADGDQEIVNSVLEMRE